MKLVEEVNKRLPIMGNVAWRLFFIYLAILTIYYALK